MSYRVWKCSNRWAIIGSSLKLFKNVIQRMDVVGPQCWCVGMLFEYECVTSNNNTTEYADIYMQY